MQVDVTEGQQGMIDGGPDYISKLLRGERSFIGLVAFRPTKVGLDINSTRLYYGLILIDRVGWIVGKANCLAEFAQA